MLGALLWGSTPGAVAVVLPACPAGEGNPVEVAAPRTIKAGRRATIEARAVFSELLGVWLLDRRRSVYLAKATDDDVLRASTVPLRAGRYRLRVSAHFAYPVPETGELGLCERVVRRVIVVRAS